MTNYITVVIPVKDTNPNYLQSAVNSVLDQDSELFTVRVCVVDDGSTSSNTLEMFTRLEKQTNVSVVTNFRTSGVAGARNTGLELADSEWVTFLDSDDAWTEDALSLFGSLLSDVPSAQFITGDTIIWREDESFLWNTGNERTEQFGRQLEQARTRESWISIDVAIDVILEYSIVPTPGSMLLDREAATAIGGFNEEIGRGEDVLFLLRMANNYPLYFIPQPVLWYRQHEDSLTWGTQPGVGHLNFLPGLLSSKGWAEWHPAIRKRLAETHDASMWWHRGRGNRLGAVYHAWNAIKYRPTHLRHWKHLIGAVLGRK